MSEKHRQASNSLGILRINEEQNWNILYLTSQNIQLCFDGKRFAVIFISNIRFITNKKQPTTTSMMGNIHFFLFSRLALFSKKPYIKSNIVPLFHSYSKQVLNLALIHMQIAKIICVKKITFAFLMFCNIRDQAFANLITVYDRINSYVLYLNLFKHLGCLPSSY